MPKIIEKTVYTFAELSDKAKQKAEHWYCENVSYFWGEEHISEIKEFLSVFNVELTRYEYSTYTFSCRTDIESCKWQANILECQDIALFSTCDCLQSIEF